MIIIHMIIYILLYKMTYRQNIGTEYEYYVLEHIRNEYDKCGIGKIFQKNYYMN